MQTEKNGQIIRQPAGAPKEEGLVRLLQKLQPEMARAMPAHLTPDRMARLALTALRTVRDLDKCTPQSFAACVMACSALGLECNTPLGEAYLIPRNNHGVKECTLIVGYFGMMALARRSGLVASIKAVEVYKGDRFEYEDGLNPRLVHVPSTDQNRDSDSKNLTHAYAIARLKDGGSEPIFVVLSRAQIDRRRKRGGGGDRGPWDTDYAAMARKTAIRELFKWTPRSAEMARAEAVEVAHETGRAPFAALPEETATALLGVGIAEPETTDDGEVVDAEFEAAPMRQPGED